MGLYLNADYQKQDDLKNLRYGSLMIMTDQDHDGSHIKGLINFIHHYWPNLLRHFGFLVEFVTPIIKVHIKKTGEHKSFFTLADYEKWNKDVRPSLGPIGKPKYYKGLGTSTRNEAREYFKDLKQHVIQFRHPTEREAVKNDIELAFSKSQADARKVWVGNYNEQLCVDHSKNTLTYHDFIHKELIHFSVADNRRSIPSVVDGLKPGQRKILFACFKRLNQG
jgi:DNA topoisomerase II